MQRAVSCVAWTDPNGSNLSDERGPRHAAAGARGVRTRPDAAAHAILVRPEIIDGAVDWKIGRITFGEDFASFSCDFQNLTFCGAQPSNLVGNYIYNWPVSQRATRLKFNPAGLRLFSVRCV
jgi:porin